jgi:uncharacterized protein YndB with AHSA1/START domain
VVKRYGAIEGGHQTLARLAGFLPTLAAGPVVAQRFTRTVAAPRTLVFQAWTDPAQLARWWGPHGFSNPRCEFAARPGGRIHIDMRGPDGATHPMSGEVRELVAPTRLAFACSVPGPDGAPLFEVLNTVGFAEAEGGKATVVTVDVLVTSRRPGSEAHLVGMEAGWTMSLDRLADLAAEPEAYRDPGRDIVAMRLFAHPREKLIAAWRDPAKLARWWGPKGFTNEFTTFDLRVGGEWVFTMRAPDGNGFPNRCRFDEIAFPERIVIEHLENMFVFTILANFYEAPGGAGTILRFRQRFASAATATQVAKFAGPANQEMFDRLEAVLREG